MIEGKHAGRGLEYRLQYQTADPFPHIVLDDFLAPAQLTNIVESIRAIPHGLWLRDEHSQQSNKFWLSDLNLMPPTVRDVCTFLNGHHMCAFLEDLSGISPIVPDPQLLGGGIHRVINGGRLGVHADFNIHPHTMQHRRINALLYLNKDWTPSERGWLELWSKGAERCVKRIEPRFNRAVIFNITDEALHGHPTVFAGVDRLSLATYYYTTDRPAHEKAPFHWASWRETPDDYNYNRLS